MYSCYNPLWLPVGSSEVATQRVPCGQCYNCQMKKRAEWDLRLWIESLYHPVTAFVTYTYEDRYLDKAHDYKEFQHLHMRMYNHGLRFKFYHVSEFGEKYGRPHNHELMFIDNDIDPRELYQFRCYGIMDVGTLTPASIHYVTKWHVHPKYRIGESKEKHGFTEQSKSMGAQLLAHWSSDNFSSSYKLPDGSILPVSRYYRKKLGVQVPDYWTWKSEYMRYKDKFPYITLDDFFEYYNSQFNYLLDKQLQQRYEKLE